MKRIFLFLLLISLGSSWVFAQKPGNLSDRLAKTIMQRHPDPNTYPWRSWCYPQGYVLMGMDKLFSSTHDSVYYRYIMKYADEHVDSLGNIDRFKGSSMDDMMAGSVIIWAYRQTGFDKYRKAADYIRHKFDDYPRTSDSLFWHGRKTKGEVWVDGVFMGQMFLTKYGKYIGDSEYCFNEAARQLIGIYNKLRKGNSGLLYHAWDEDRDAKWADPKTGLSPEVWSEGLGWYALILVETLEIFPKVHPQREELEQICRNVMAGLKKVQDPKTGLWFQVVDKGNQSNNWNDTSGSAMFVYAIKRAGELGIIPEKQYRDVVDEAYRGLLTKAVTNPGDGLTDIVNACDGLCVQPSYDAYIHYPQKVNAKEAVAGVLWASWIMEKPSSGTAKTIMSGKGHPFVCTDYTQGKVFIVNAQGKSVWEYPAKHANDIWILPNGNLLFNTGNGVKEVTRDKKVVFDYESTSGIYACQRLTNGNTFIGECDSARLLEVAPDGKIVKEIHLFSHGQKGDNHFMRNARKLPNGNYLVAHYGLRVVKEYDANGKVVWECQAPGGPHSAVRLPNGNTMIACTDQTKNASLIEVDPAGKVVWKVESKDLPGISLEFMTGFQVLPNGNIVMTNWLGHGKFGKAPHIIEITRKKKVVWTFFDHMTMKTISSIQLLDVKGDDVKGEILH